MFFETGLSLAMFLFFQITSLYVLIAKFSMPDCIPVISVIVCLLKAWHPISLNLPIISAPPTRDPRRRRRHLCVRSYGSPFTWAPGAGVQEHNYVAHVMAYAACIGTNQKLCAAGHARGAALPTSTKAFHWLTLVVTSLAKEVMF